MFEVTVFSSFIAGVLSFFSPCILPVVPGYLGFLGSLAAHDTENKATRSALITASIVFVSGFLTVFLLLGFSSNFLGQIIARNLLIFQQIAGGLIIVFGLHFLGLLPSIGAGGRLGQLMNRDWRFMPSGKIGASDNRHGILRWLGIFIVGLAFGFGWTPCVGPVLASILLMISTSEHSAQGPLLMLLYGLGMGLPFILFAVFAEGYKRAFPHLRLFSRWIKYVFGSLMLITGVAMMTGMINEFGFWILRNTSWFGAVG